MGNLKFKVNDRVRVKSLEWYNENKNKYGKIDCNESVFFEANMSKFCGSILTIKNIDVDIYAYDVEENSYFWTDEMLEGLVEDETPKFKVNDIVFVKNIGWVKITNSYWDSLANEYIYEAIGFNGEGEYDNINQSNIEDKMLSESENPPTCGNKITLDEYKNNDKEWLFNKLALLDNITAIESIQDIFNHLQQSKYPKTYEECCGVLGMTYDFPDIRMVSSKECCLYSRFIRLIRCRDAYWNIADNWKPDWNESKPKYTIVVIENKLVKHYALTQNYILAFPTAEMRDAFYENFKDLIENCKELL